MAAVVEPKEQQECAKSRDETMRATSARHHRRTMVLRFGSKSPAATTTCHAREQQARDLRRRPRPRRRSCSHFGPLAKKYGWTVVRVLPDDEPLPPRPPARRPRAVATGCASSNGGYATAFNPRHGRRTISSAGGSGIAHCETERHLLETLRATSCSNPVRAGLPAARRDWQWSSYRGDGRHRTPPYRSSQRDELLAALRPPTRRSRRDALRRLRLAKDMPGGSHRG